MFRRARTVVLILIVLGAFAPASTDIRAREAATLQAGPQESEMPGVTSEVAYLRQYNGALHAGILFKNTGAREATGGAIAFSAFTLVENGHKHFPLKDADGHYLAGPISDWNGGGRVFPHVAAKSQLLVWAMFEPIAAPAVDVSLPLSQPFQAVPIADAAPASADVGTAAGTLRASL
ncbi:MAG: hypothetical protein ACRD1V_19975, partial [Vicinamibacterales bacterium]